jgi:hypothetical protein
VPDSDAGRPQKPLPQRFCNPLSRYRFLYWKETGRLDGYLVLQTSILPDRRGINIVDWEANRWEVQAQLLRAALECTGFGDLTVWSATTTDEARALLRDVGFSQPARTVGVAAANHRILIRPVSDDMLKREWVVGGRRLLDPAGWDLRMIDSDAH